MSRIQWGVGAGLLASFLSGCGGGGGGGGGGVAPPPPEPTVVRLNAALAGLPSEAIASGDELKVQLQAQWSHTGPAPSQVFLQVRDAQQSFELPESRAGAGAWNVDLALRSTLPVGGREGQLEVRACRDSACAEPYPGAQALLPYKLSLFAAPDWTTHQGSNSHTGYVPIRLNPSQFKQAWTWQRPTPDEPIGGINAVVAQGGTVFVTNDVYFGEAVLYALAESDGQPVWTRSLGRRPAFSPPAVSAERVYAASSGHEDSFLWGFDLKTGAIQSKSPFEGQWPNLLHPTLVEGTAVLGAGYYGGTLYAYSMADGNPLWKAEVGGAWDMYSVAADGQRLYHHNGRSLLVLDRSQGTELARIEDIVGNGGDSSYHGGPVLGRNGVVIAYSGGAFSGRGASSVEPYGTRVLTAFDTVNKKALWNSAVGYRSTPALAEGVVYVGNDLSLDALEESTGKLLWRFIPDPVADGNTLHRNAVATRTHLFVSTDRNVLALDLKTRSVVWRYPKPGQLAISAGRTLFINVGARESSGELVAVRLK